MNAAIQAVFVAAWLCAPAFAVDHDMSRGTALPGSTTAQVDERGTTDGDLRNAPASQNPATPRGVSPGRQDYGRGYSPSERGANPPVERAPEAGRRWGLIVFVIAIVALGLMAFRRRNPMPPNP